MALSAPSQKKTAKKAVASFAKKTVSMALHFWLPPSVPWVPPDGCWYTYSGDQFAADYVNSATEQLHHTHMKSLRPLPLKLPAQGGHPRLTRVCGHDRKEASFISSPCHGPPAKAPAAAPGGPFPPLHAASGPGLVPAAATGPLVAPAGADLQPAHCFGTPE